MFMKAWPIWSSLLLAVLICAIWAAGWFDLAAWIVAILLIGPVLYVIVVIAFFGNSRS